MDSHRLVLWAERQAGKGEAVAHAMGRRYFEGARPLADHAMLREVASPNPRSSPNPDPNPSPSPSLKPSLNPSPNPSPNPNPNPNPDRDPNPNRDPNPDPNTSPNPDPHQAAEEVGLDAAAAASYLASDAGFEEVREIWGDMGRCREI